MAGFNVGCSGYLVPYWRPQYHQTTNRVYFEVRDSSPVTPAYRWGRKRWSIALFYLLTFVLTGFQKTISFPRLGMCAWVWGVLLKSADLPCGMLLSLIGQIIFYGQWKHWRVFCVSCWIMVNFCAFCVCEALHKDFDVQMRCSLML